MKHPYPDHAYLERDDETNEKRWYSTKGMGVRYVHEDRVAEDVAVAVKAERERCLKIAEYGIERAVRDWNGRDAQVAAESMAREIAEVIRSES